MKIINDYFINYSSNIHQVCCEDSPTKGQYDRCQSGDLNRYSRSQLCLKRFCFLTCNISDNISAILHSTWHDGRRLDAIYTHARFDDFDLDAKSQWVGKGKIPSVTCSRKTKQAISIKLATTVSHF